MEQIDEATFCAEDIVFQMGVVPTRIDIMTGIDGVTFADAWPRRVALGKRVLRP